MNVTTIQTDKYLYRCQTRYSERMILNLWLTRIDTINTIRTWENKFKWLRAPRNTLQKIEKSRGNENGQNTFKDIFIKQGSKRSRRTPCNNYHSLKTNKSANVDKVNNQKLSSQPNFEVTWKANIKKIHIRSKLLKRCQNVRTSTKFVLELLFPGMTGLGPWKYIDFSWMFQELYTMINSTYQKKPCNSTEVTTQINERRKRHN